MKPLYISLGSMVTKTLPPTTLISLGKLFGEVLKRGGWGAVVHVGSRGEEEALYQTLGEEGKKRVVVLKEDIPHALLLPQCR